MHVVPGGKSLGSGNTPKNQLNTKVFVVQSSANVVIEPMKVYVYLDTSDAVTVPLAVKSIEKMLTDSGGVMVEIGDLERGSVLVNLKAFFAHAKEPSFREKVKRKGAEYGAYGEQAVKDATTNARRAWISQVNAQTVAIYLPTPPRLRWSR